MSVYESYEDWKKQYDSKYNKLEDEVQGEIQALTWNSLSTKEWDRGSGLGFQK